jgi:exopolyphosphatase/guanosine-5'-triphosphate,3'-diphosphate pyrophosphatase
MKAAALDLGTNTFQLLIAEQAQGGFRILHRERVFVKIGQGGISQGYLTDEACERAMQAIAVFHEVLTRYQVDCVVATATSAIRNALNGQTLLQQIEALTGIVPRTISGDEEAGLIYLGMTTVLDMGDTTHLIVDIGGGSVESIMANGKEILWKQSVEIGAQRLYDRFHHTEPISPEAVTALNLYLKMQLHEVLEAVARYQPTVLVGCAGTFSTMKAMFSLAYDQPEAMSQHAFVMSATHYMALHQTLLTHDLAQRIALPGMLKERADMIVVASCIVAFLLQHTGFQELTISAASLKEGLLKQVFLGIH